ncbi:MAG TPA: CheR family methyltransferase [Ktedonobacteraceae bacterium]|nr:CheR family methyltransferase [Ktedonobacteraceae bacterium]
MSAEEKEEVKDGGLVVIGSSAGGIEAASVLVSTLPVDFPAPIVLAQHLDPTRASNLDVILRQRSTLPVELVTGRTQLESGKVYVVPSNRQVSILDGHVDVQEDAHMPTRPRPSVDLLFASAAEAYGDRLIAVILTGSGSDGAAGAVEVKNAGGTVLVQNPQTARYPSMPLALPPSIIDSEADLERIGPLLYDLLTGVTPPHTEDKTDEVLQQILVHVSRQASLDFHPYKISTIIRRIRRRMVVTHNSTMREYLEYLKEHPEEVGELVKAFLINVTQFFRDPNAFVSLKNDILPHIIAQARDRDRVLRIWTAGCATGEEPYSLAMLLTDLLGAELPEWSVKIFATDLSETAISFARRGLYSENVLTGVPTSYRDRFFERADHGYRVSKILRQMVIFGQQDLARSAPFPRIDLLLCRNVLIYFTPELQDYVLNQFAYSLTPGGYLFLGKAETVRPTQNYFELVDKRWKLYRCVGNVVPTVYSQRLTEQQLPHLEVRSPQRPNASPGKQAPERDSPSQVLELGQLRRLNELLLRFLPTGVVVIDRSYHVLTANSTARRLLGLRDIGSEQDFLHAVRGIPYTPVRTAIDAVFRERNSLTLPEVTFDPTLGGNNRSVSISIALMQQEAGTPDMAVMSVTDVTEQIQVRRQLETAQNEQAQLMQELGTSNTRLNEINKELLDSNEELQVSNEELVLAHEELQATIEEFETTNEELQATNEELETSNEELQATNEELETTNEELRARTNELQELTHMLDSERMRLSEMVELAPFSILMLRGPRLLVEAYTPRYTPPVDTKTVQNQPLDDVFDHFWKDGVHLVRLIHEVYQQNEMRTTPRMLTLVLKDGVPVERYIVYTLVPSHDGAGRVSGVLLYAVDETERLVKEAEEERARLRMIFDNTHAVGLALYDARNAALIMGSPRYLDMVAHARGKDQSELPGSLWYELLPDASSEEAIEIWKMVIESHVPLRRPEVHIKLAGDEPETIWDWTLTPVMRKEEPDTVQYLLVSAVEITEQTQVRQEVERLNRLRDEFLSLASHELRTPLTSIQGNAELLHRKLQRQVRASPSEEMRQSVTAPLSSEQDVQAVERIIRQSNRLNRLIEEMLDVTRLQGEVLELKNQEDVNLVELVRRVVDSYAATNRVISAETTGEALVGNWDETRIEQVLHNLISNALKYSPANTSVKVGLKRQPNEAVIWVKDQGQGMSEEQQTHIFDRFYRLSRDGRSSVEGLGLGLYIAHEIITRQGGRMWIESTPGEGSTFFVSLPLEKTDSQQPAT